MKQIALAFLFLTVAPVIAHAQQMACGPAAEMMPGLETKFGEHPVVVGALASGAKMTITANSETGTWSFLLLLPDNVTACIMASGDGLQAAPQPVKKPGSPS